MVRLTVKDGLAEGHDRRAEGQQHRKSGGPTLQYLLTAQNAADRLALGEVNVDVYKIHDRLNHVQASLSRSEAVALIPCFPAVNIVYATVQLVGSPQRPVNYEKCWSVMLELQCLGHASLRNPPSMVCGRPRT